MSAIGSTSRRPASRGWLAWLCSLMALLHRRALVRRKLKAERQAVELRTISDGRSVPSADRPSRSRTTIDHFDPWRYRRSADVWSLEQVGLQELTHRRSQRGGVQFFSCLFMSHYRLSPASRCVRRRRRNDPSGIEFLAGRMARSPRPVPAGNRPDRACTYLLTGRRISGRRRKTAML